MKWQDIVIAVCQICFLPAMIPTIKGKNKPAFSTSALNAMLVLIITGCLFSLHLWFASATAAPVAVIWVVLAVQKYNMDR